MSSRRLIDAPPAETWPFRYPLCPELPAGPVTVRAFDVDEAYVNAQTGGTQLVTTQKKYLRRGMGGRARKARKCDVAIEVDTAGPPPSPRLRRTSKTQTQDPLPRAFRATDPAERLALCVEALKSGRTPAALVATASACMEVNDLEAAARDLDEAIAQAPQWAAAHYERGKLWLRQDDMVKAAESFQRAAELLPGFAPAWANLGGTLGELDRPQEALAAFERALAIDPASPQALNNVGVVRRELGRLSGVRSRIPAGHPAHAGDGLWPLQSGAYTVFTGAFPRRALGVCRGAGARP